jgi:hypothetical protein
VDEVRNSCVDESEARLWLCGEVREKTMFVWMRSETRLWLCECGQRQGYGCFDEVRDKAVCLNEVRDKAMVVWMRRSETRLSV